MKNIIAIIALTLVLPCYGQNNSNCKTQIVQVCPNSTTQPLSLGGGGGIKGQFKIMEFMLENLSEIEWERLQQLADSDMELQDKEDVLMKIQSLEVVEMIPNETSLENKVDLLKSLNEAFPDDKKLLKSLQNSEKLMQNLTSSQ